MSQRFASHVVEDLLKGSFHGYAIGVDSVKGPDERPFVIGEDLLDSQMLC